MDLNKVKQDLEPLLRTVGLMAKTGFNQEDKEITTKADENDFLTKYDLLVNERITNFLTANYPGISIISEEAPEISRNSPYAFVIDPIDGTRNFVRNIPIFFTGIALVKDKETILSITFNPITEELFWAIRGQGSFQNNKRIMVVPRELKVSDLVINTGSSRKLQQRTISRIAQKVCLIRNNSCCHHDLSSVTCGRYDGIISDGSYPWDYCHYLLVEEAGGKVTDWQGQKFDLTKDNIVVSNGVIHEELLRVVSKNKS